MRRARTERRGEERRGEPLTESLLTSPTLTTIALLATSHSHTIKLSCKTNYQSSLEGVVWSVPTIFLVYEDDAIKQANTSLSSPHT